MLSCTQGHPLLLQIQNTKYEYMLSCTQECQLLFQIQNTNINISLVAHRGAYYNCKYKIQIQIQIQVKLHCTGVPITMRPRRAAKLRCSSPWLSHLHCISKWKHKYAHIYIWVNFCRTSSGFQGISTNFKRDQIDVWISLAAKATYSHREKIDLYLHLLETSIAWCQSPCYESLIILWLCHVK